MEAISDELRIAGHIDPGVIVVSIPIDDATDLVKDHVKGFLLVRGKNLLALIKLFTDNGFERLGDLGMAGEDTVTVTPSFEDFGDISHWNSIQLKIRRMV